MKLKGALYYRRIFGSFGNNSVLYKPMLLGNPHLIHIGNDVTIRSGVRLEAITIDPKHPAEIRIGNNVNIEQDVHIVAMGKIEIHDNVSITARSSLLCGFHPFFDVDNPTKIGSRLGGSKSHIAIGENSFLGIGAVVTMNVKIGRNVVVGTYSVVKNNIPDYSVVDGNPATVALSYNAETGQWRPPAKIKEK